MVTPSVKMLKFQNLVVTRQHGPFKETLLVKCLDERKSSFNNQVIAKRAENAARISEYEEAEKAGQK